ncbi:MAG: PAS domain S-box protein [Chloroflexi bacterium]|nr:PAS domain S-box protein [Chloroflexota bacterium]
MEQNELQVGHSGGVVQASERRWALLAQQMPLAMIEWDTELHVLDWNPAAERLFGFTREEALGRAAWDFIVPASAREHVQQVGQSLLEQKRPVRSINENVTRDGRTLICDWYNTPLVNERGEVVGLNSMVLDITERVQARRALTESEERHRLTLDSSPDPIVIYDLEGRAQYVNPAFVQTFGWTEEELIGKRIAFVPDEVMEETLQTVQSLFAGSKVSAANTRRLTKDGRVLDVQLSASAYLDKDGRPVGRISILRDVTQQRRAEEALRESEERYRTLLEQIKEGYYEVDLDGRLKFCNDTLTEILGYSREELMTRNFASLMDEANAAKLIALGQRVFTTGEAATAQDCEIITGSGEKKYIELSALLMRDANGTPVGYRGMARDITERKRAEAELQHAKDAAEAANRAKSVFLANMSHELRTPLNAIIGYSEMLQEDAADLGYEELVPDLKKIQAAGRHLLDLINNILDLSKIEAGKMDLYLESFDLATMIEDVKATIQPLAEKNRNTFTVHYPPDIGAMLADLTKVRQTLFNLLSNACKFTNGGAVSLSVSRQPNDGIDWITFRVSDTGIGLSGDQLQELFKEFTQADTSTTRKFGGTGLGLAISRHFCQLMHGDILVESEPGQGAVFTVLLPADVSRRKTDSASADADSDDPTQPTDPRSTVLVIDDDPVARDLVARYLVKEGFRVETAATGDQGLMLAKQRRPDAITLDVLLPGKDGWAVLSALKADPELADVPVVMLTILDDKQMGFSLGAADYLTKPVDRRQLVSLLEKYTHQSARDNGYILVAEDDDSTREIVRHMLEKEGWTVAEAENGVVALSLLAQRPPSLLLLDLMMPEMDGFHVVAEMRKNPDWAQIPVVVITAMTLTDAERRELNGTVEQVLQKGVLNPDQLLRHVRDLVRKHTRR